MRATILPGIIIGKGGSAIKRIGRDARTKIEQLIGKKVFIDLFVSVKKGWTTDKEFLNDMGYEI